jgi:hypothetical protein
VLGVIDAAALDRTTLKACCLVSRTFSAYAQALLFRSVRLETYRQFSAYSKSINPSTERGRILAQLTRSLSFLCEHDFVQLYERLALRDIAKLLPNLPKLYHLELYLRGPLNLNADDLAVMSRATSITSLHLHNFTKFGQTVVHDMLGAMPQITKLRLDGSAFRIVSGRMPLQLALSELHWHISLEPSALELRWLLGESSDLRALSIDIPTEGRTTVFSERLLQLVLERYGQNVRFLRLSDRVDSLDFVRLSCPNLTELFLRFWPTPSVLASLPPGLTHLGLARPDKTVANEPALLELMSSLGHFVGLQTLTWLERDEVSTNERTALRRFCDARGIVILERNCSMKAQVTSPRRALGTPVHRRITIIREI